MYCFPILLSIILNFLTNCLNNKQSIIWGINNNASCDVNLDNSQDIN